MANVTANKNQTAVERAQAAEILSGKKCSKCGKDIKLKDLMSVKQVSMETGAKVIAPDHRACYSF